MHFFKVLIILFSLTGCTYLHKPISQPTIKPTQVFNTAIDDNIIDNKTLVLLDIDNTIISAKTDYGSAEFFSQMIKDEAKKKNISEKQAKVETYDRWVKSQKIIETKLLDKQIHDFINKAKFHGAMVIGFTARQPVIINVTYNQLKKHNIVFDDFKGLDFIKAYRNPLNNDKDSIAARFHDSQARFYRGILFCHDLNTKGKVFKDFYTVLSTYRQNVSLPQINKIIFFDDAIHNIDSMAETAKELNVEFYGYHFNYKNEGFNSQEAYKQERLAIR